MKELTALKSLETLYLHCMNVKDAGLKELDAIKSLTTLHLGNTKVTEAGVKEFKQAHPNCEVD